MTASTPDSPSRRRSSHAAGGSGYPGTLRRLVPAPVRLLAQGEPGSPSAIAGVPEVPVDQAEAVLGGIRDIEWTATQGSRASAPPSARRRTNSAGNAEMYTWCPIDTLIIAAIDHAVQIQSRGGATGEALRLEADGQRITAAGPPSIAVSWFFDAAATSFRASVCQFGHFFASRESAAEWAAKYPQGAAILTLDEAMDASRSLVAQMFGPTDGAES